MEVCPVKLSLGQVQSLEVFSSNSRGHALKSENLAR